LRNRLQGREKIGLENYIGPKGKRNFTAQYTALKVKEGGGGAFGIQRELGAKRETMTIKKGEHPQI